MQPSTNLNLTNHLILFIKNNNFDPQKCSIENISSQAAAFKARVRIINHFSKGKKKDSPLEIIQNLLSQDSFPTTSQIETILLDHDFKKCQTDIKIITEACKKSSISKSTFYDLMKTDPEFKTYCTNLDLKPQDLKRVFSKSSIENANQFEPNVRKKTKKIADAEPDFQDEDVADLYLDFSKTKNELVNSQEASPRIVKDESFK